MEAISYINIMDHILPQQTKKRPEKVSQIWTSLPQAEHIPGMTYHEPSKPNSTLQHSNSKIR